jgi:hypothetical protein
VVVAVPQEGYKLQQASECMD